MTLSLSAAERNALYEELFIRLGGIDSVRLAAESNDFERAQSLAIEFSDLLRLIAHDLGWGTSTHVQDIALTTDPLVVGRVFQRVYERTSDLLATQDHRAEEVKEMQDHCRVVIAACGNVLSKLQQIEPCTS
jgi:hypothetical protein